MSDEIIRIVHPPWSVDDSWTEDEVVKMPSTSPTPSSLHSATVRATPTPSPSPLTLPSPSALSSPSTLPSPLTLPSPSTSSPVVCSAAARRRRKTLVASLFTLLLLFGCGVLTVALHQRGDHYVTATTSARRSKERSMVRYASGILLPVANGAIGFAVGIPGIPGVWDNVVLGVAGSLFGNEYVASVTSRMVDGARSFLHRLERIGHCACHA